MKKLLIFLLIFPLSAHAATVAPTQAAVDAKAPLASPALTGNPTAPTQTAGNNSTRIATTAFAVGEATSPANALTAMSAMTADQQASARSAQGVGDYYVGVNYSPLAASRIWKDGRLADSRPPLTVMLAGDSLMDSVAAPDLFPEMNFNGWKLMRDERAVVVAGTATTSTDGTWFTPDYRSISASSTVEYVPPTGVTTGVRANRVGVLYYKGASSANTFQLQYSQNNGGSWSNAGSAIDTSLASSNVAWYEFALSNAGTATRVRVTTSGGQTAKVIGCGVWFGDTDNFAGLGGWVLVEAWKGSITPAVVANTANTTPTALSASFADMQINLVLNSWFDLPACWDTGSDFDDIKTACDAGLVADWVFLTPGPMNTTGTSVLGTGNTPDQDSKLARLAAINWAVRQSQNVIDLYPRWGSWDNAKRLGMMSNADDYHPTAIGKIKKREICADIFSRELITQKDAVYIGRGPGGRKIYITADEYAVRSGAESNNPLSTLLWTHTGAFTASDAITATGTLNVNGALVAAPQGLATAGTTQAVNLTTATTLITTTGASHNLSLANGTEGQIKTIIHKVDGGSAILTPTTASGYTTITFTNVNESVTLQYVSGLGWVILAIRGAVAA